jgi:hypothetical protein
MRVDPDAPSAEARHDPTMSSDTHPYSSGPPGVSRGWRVAALALGVVAALGASRAWLREWGASPEEAAGALPGDRLVPEPADQTTRGVTVAAPPDAVWPWLVQMGQGRGGFYAYDAVEHLLGMRTPSATEIVAEHQSLRAGDEVRMTPDPWLSSLAGRFFSVVEVDPRRSISLLQRRPSGELIGWTFALRPCAEGTRLLVRTRRSHLDAPARRLAQWAELTLLGPGEALMERAMLRGVARRAEGAPG